MQEPGVPEDMEYSGDPAARDAGRTEDTSRVTGLARFTYPPLQHPLEEDFPRHRVDQVYWYLKNFRYVVRESAWEEVLHMYKGIEIFDPATYSPRFVQ